MINAAWCLVETAWPCTIAETLVNIYRLSCWERKWRLANMEKLRSNIGSCGQNRGWRRWLHRISEIDNRNWTRSYCCWKLIINTLNRKSKITIANICWWITYPSSIFETLIDSDTREVIEHKSSFASNSDWVPCSDFIWINLLESTGSRVNRE